MTKKILSAVSESINEEVWKSYKHNTHVFCLQRQSMRHVTVKTVILSSYTMSNITEEIKYSLCGDKKSKSI